jgi:acyl-CoA dehydrogenase
MNIAAPHPATPSAARENAEERRAGVAADAAGQNFYLIDRSLREVLPLRLPPELRDHFEPHFTDLGAALGGTLDDQARLADRHPPVLHHRDRHGADRQWIEFHPAYRALEEAGFSRFGLAAGSHAAGVLGWDAPLTPIIKYVMTYLFAQTEFGLLCPISMTDAMTRVLRRFADADLLERYLPGLVSLDPEQALQGAMFMTEKAGGSDVGAAATVAREIGGQWRLYGDKWFCSNADADLALVLARPEGAAAGTRGLGLFLMPRLLEDGRPNAYRFVRLKEKLGTRSMASGEVVLDGALAYAIGPLDRGFVQMAEMINASRLSNGVRAAGLMRRALNEAFAVCRSREAFGKRLMDLPLQRRQMLKIMLPAEQALSMVLYTALVLERADAGEEQAARLVRLLTPLIKFRACRDARKVTGDAMEIRAGCGYVEDFVEPRLLRDAHLGSIWEGTSNIVAIDAIRRAVGRQGGDGALLVEMRGLLAQCRGLPAGLVAALENRLSRAVMLARAAAKMEDEREMRRAASMLYHAASAVLLAWEGAAGGVARRRAVLAGLVVRHRLSPSDPLSSPAGGADLGCEAVLLDESEIESSRIDQTIEAMTF